MTLSSLLRKYQHEIIIGNISTFEVILDLVREDPDLEMSLVVRQYFDDGSLEKLFNSNQVVVQISDEPGAPHFDQVVFDLIYFKEQEEVINFNTAMAILDMTKDDYLLWRRLR